LRCEGNRNATNAQPGERRSEVEAEGAEDDENRQNNDGGFEHALAENHE